MHGDPRFMGSGINMLFAKLKVVAIMCFSDILFLSSLIQWVFVFGGAAYALATHILKVKDIKKKHWKGS